VPITHFSSGKFHSNFGTKDVLKILISITTSASCKNCQDDTLHSIENKQMPFNIPQQDNSPIMITAQASAVQIISISDEKSTTKEGNSTSMILVSP